MPPRQDIQDAEVHWTTKHGKSVCMSLRDLRDATEAQLTLGTDTDAYEAIAKEMRWGGSIPLAPHS